jgi:hypothetical protein
MEYYIRKKEVEEIIDYVESFYNSVSSEMSTENPFIDGSLVALEEVNRFLRMRLTEYEELIGGRDV